MNKVLIIGNLTKDPEYRQTPSGMPVLEFGIAVNDRVKNKQTGEWENYPNFLDCVLFGTRADSLIGLLYKGIRVGVTGKLHYESWTDKQTKQSRSRIKIWIDEIDLLSPKKNNKNNNNDNNKQDIFQDEIPF